MSRQSRAIFRIAKVSKFQVVSWSRTPLGQTTKPKTTFDFVGFWRIHTLEKGQTTGKQTLTNSSLLYQNSAHFSRAV
jgi:hypothetical protein